jgi:hypothetical protein
VNVLDPPEIESQMQAPSELMVLHFPHPRMAKAVSREPPTAYQQQEPPRFAVQHIQHRSKTSEDFYGTDDDVRCLVPSCFSSRPRHAFC